MSTDARTAKPKADGEVDWGASSGAHRRDRSSPPPAKRRLDRALFAMARGWVQGMELRALAHHYLAGNTAVRDSTGDPDLRVAKSTLEYVLDELAAAARREGLAREAALLRRQAARIRPRTAAVEPPTLEEFAEHFPPDFYGEAQLLELYEAEFGGAAGGQQHGGRRRSALPEDRRDKLIARQLALLARLEERLGAELTRASPLADWLEPATVARLADAGLHAVGELVEHIQGSQRRWWTDVRAVGEAKAARIERLLEASLGPLRRQAPAPRAGLSRHQATVSVQEPSGSLRPTSYGTGVVPLERLAVPGEIDGSRGTLRLPDSMALIGARNDYDAILAFLATHVSEHTRRAYRKELERFLLWAVLERRKPVSSMTVEDCVAYRTFLRNPMPRSLWCGKRSRQRFGPLWRPFEGPLASSSQAQALTRLHAFYAWANQVRYLSGNPWANVKATGEGLPAEGARSARADVFETHEPAASTEFRPRERALSVEQWKFVCEQLTLLPSTGWARRLRFVLALAYSTGMRLSELVRARVGHLHYEPPEADDSGGWVLSVRGKGDRVRELTLLDEVVVSLQRYLTERGLPADLAAVDPGVYLIGRVDDLHQRLRAADRLHGAAMPDLADDGSDGQGLMRLPAPGDGVKGTTLYKEIKAHFARCADALEAHDRKGADRLRSASTHWLRHSHATHALKRGLPLEIVREVLGHASLSTTSRYVRPERGDRRRAMRKLVSLVPTG